MGREEKTSNPNGQLLKSISKIREPQCWGGGLDLYLAMWLGMCLFDL